MAAEYVGNAQGLETASLVVTTTDDVVNNADGFTSLREAINFAHSDGVNSAITFAVSGTIRLTSALPALANNGSLSISNHQSGIVTISGDANGSGINDAGDVRIFSVNSGANVALHRLMLSGGRAVDGGAIHNNGGTVVVTDSTFTRHVASNYGGALFNTNGTLTVIRSTLATNSAFYGGAIFNVTTNIAAGQTNPASFTLIRNSTLSENTASSTGGAVFNAQGLVRIESSTIADNIGPANVGSGVASVGDADTSTRVQNSIIANNRTSGGGANSGTDIDRVFGGINSFISQGHNAIGDGSGAGAFIQTGDQAGVTAAQVQLNPLADNGGPTQTRAVLAGSVAINTGNSNESTDQRGTVRPQPVARPDDIGAFEFDSYSESLVVTTSADEDNTTSDPTFGAGTSLREAIFYAGTLSGPQTITFNIPPSDSGYESTTGIYTIQLAINGDDTFGPSALRVNGHLTVDGSARKITITRNTVAQPTRLRLFYVAPTGNLTLQNLTLSGGRAKGGDSELGGGGAGLGGAIINAGSLTLRGVTLRGNQANGGSFFDGPGIRGGGGGGLGGDSSDNDGGGPNGGGHYITDGGFGGGGGGFGVGGQGGFGGGGRYERRGGFGGGGGFGAGESSGGFGGGTGRGGRGGGSGGGGGMGGAIFNYGGNFTISNVTFTDNSATGGYGTGEDGSGLGGAIFNLNGTVTATNATLANNIAPQGGGAIYSLGDNGIATQAGPTLPNHPAIVILNNAILSGSHNGAPSPAVVSDFIQNTNDSGTGGGAGTASSSGANNIIQSPAGSGKDFAGTAANVDPLLNSLGDHGGVTRTLALQAGSPAIDAGNNAAATSAGLTTDQRGAGFPRVFNGTVDIGAYEFQGIPPQFTSTSQVTFITGNAGTFTVTVSGLPPPAISSSGTLPSGVTLVDNGNGTATLAGTPATGTRGIYPLTFTANNGVTPAANQNFTFSVSNAAPVAPEQTFVRAPELSWKIRISDLLAACSDPDNDSLTLDSIGASAQGATITRTATHLLYSLPGDANDSFSYTISDGQGGTKTGTLEINVVNPGGLIQTLSTSGGAVTLKLAGIPGFIYEIQRATDLAGPWTRVDIQTAPERGLFTYTDSGPPQPTAYYRIQQSVPR